MQWMEIFKAKLTEEIDSVSEQKKNDPTDLEISRHMDWL